MSSNDRYTVSCTAQMLPAMLHALVIARNTAMLAGAKGKGAMAELQEMLDGLALQAGVPDLKVTVNEYDWYRAAEALKSAKEYHWHTKEGHRRVWDDPSTQQPGEVTLVVDDREYRLGYGLKDDYPHIAALRDLIEQYAAVDAVKGPPRSHWRSHAELEKSRRPEPEPKPETARAASHASAAYDEDGLDDEEFDGDDGHDHDGDPDYGPGM